MCQIHFIYNISYIITIGYSFEYRIDKPDDVIY